MSDMFVFLEVAFEDLNASKSLYSNGFYPQSIFYLQQSIEKIVKYIGLKNGTITQDELMSPIGHKTSKIFKKEVVKRIDISDYQSADEVYQDFQKISSNIDSTKIEDVIAEIKRAIELFDSTPKEEIPNMDVDSPEKLMAFMANNGFAKSEINDFQKNIRDKDVHELIKKKIKLFILELAEYQSYSNFICSDKLF